MREDLNAIILKRKELYTNPVIFCQKCYASMMGNCQTFYSSSACIYSSSILTFDFADFSFVLF